MIDRDDAWLVRLQEGVRTDLGANWRETTVLARRLLHWFIQFLRGLALVSHAIMGPPEPKPTPAQLLAERRARRRKRRAARRRARRERTARAASARNSARV